LRGAVTLWSSARSPWRATSDLLLGCSQIVVGEIGGAPRIHARRTALRTRSRARLGSRLKKWRMRSSSRSRPEKLHPPDNPEVRCGVALASVGTAASTRSAMRRLSEARCKAAVARGCPCRHERRTQRPALNGLAYRQTPSNRCLQGCCKRSARSRSAEQPPRRCRSGRQGAAQVLRRAAAAVREAAGSTYASRYASRRWSPSPADSLWWRADAGLVRAQPHTHTMSKLVDVRVWLGPVKTLEG
jgi:hypothetical protein